MQIVLGIIGVGLSLLIAGWLIGGAYTYVIKTWITARE